jgi:hypothetical protein
MAVTFPQFLSAGSKKSPARRVPRIVSLHKNPVIKEPYNGAWLAEGDYVESFEGDYWYSGEIRFVKAHGMYGMLYPNGEEDIVDQYRVRPFEHHYPGAQLEVYVADDETFYSCTMLYPMVNGTCIVEFNETIKDSSKREEEG